MFSMPLSFRVSNVIYQFDALLSYYLFVIFVSSLSEKVFSCISPKSIPPILPRILKKNLYKNSDISPACSFKVTHKEFSRKTNNFIFYFFIYSKVGLKYEKAQEWGIPCVTLRWLRDVLHSDGKTKIDINDSQYSMMDSTGESETLKGFLLDVNKTQNRLGNC